MQIYNAFKHFRTITQHKIIVMDLCFKVGMIRQGLLHDLSKYSPTEFLSGVYYYQGFKSPNAAEKIEKGYSKAWLHHKGRNKHHFEYWIDYSLNPEEGLVGMKMPLRYVLEMTCDRIAASMVYSNGEYTDAVPWEYYSKREGQSIHLHKESKALLEKLLLINRDKGLKKTLAYMRWLLKHAYLYDEREYKA